MIPFQLPSIYSKKANKSGNNVLKNLQNKLNIDGGDNIKGNSDFGFNSFLRQNSVGILNSRRNSRNQKGSDYF